MHALAIVMASVLVCVVYGIIHDQITARICIEYFTIGHPKILQFETSDPTLLGFVWGIAATWWVGLLLGVPLAIASRFGNYPKQTTDAILRQLLLVAAAAAVVAVLAGLVGWLAASQQWVFLVPPMSERVPADKHVAFLIDLWAHSASYLVGFIGGIVLIVKTLRWRQLQQRETEQLSVTH